MREEKHYEIHHSIADVCGVDAVATTFRGGRRHIGGRTLLLRILRSSLPVSAPAHVRHLPAPPRWCEQGEAQALRGAREIRVHLQILRQALPVNHADDRRTVPQSSQRGERGQPFPGTLTTRQRSCTEETSHSNARGAATVSPRLTANMPPPSMPAPSGVPSAAA